MSDDKTYTISADNDIKPVRVWITTSKEKYEFIAISEYDQLRELLKEAVEIIKKVTTAEMGGTPDLFWPDYYNEEYDVSSWEIHNEKSEAFISKTKEALK